MRSNFIEITLQHECSPVDLLQTFRTPFLKNTSKWLLLFIGNKKIEMKFESYFFGHTKSFTVYKYYDKFLIVFKS